jgi:hypothetical protein
MRVFLYVEMGCSLMNLPTPYRGRLRSLGSRELAVDQIHNLSEVPSGFAVYYDMLAVDDSEQRVMLTNNPNLNLATEKEYLPAKTWTEGTIEVYLRQGTFASIHGAYVCVQDEDGNQIGEGFQLQ